MPNFLCNSECGALVQPPKSFEVLCEKPGRKKYGFPYLVFVSRDVVLPDPTDIPAWEALVASGDVCISPCGKVEPTVSPTVSSDSNNCGIEEVIETVYDLVYSTKSADKDALTHCAYYESLVSNPCLNVFLMDCDGNPYLTPEYRDFANGGMIAPVGNPGYEFSMTSPPVPTNSDGNFELWTFTIQVKLDGSQIFCPVVLPILNALLGVVTPP